MKKLSKKQKTIGVIAIILIAVILAIVVITSITRNNSQLFSEGYEATTANAGSNLVAEYIKEGITIGGITGTLKDIDTSDATATACDIAKGKTAYVNGEKITGRYIVYESTLGTVTGNETSNTTVNDIYGNKVVVPAGFKIVNPNDNVTDGIVIEDVSAGDSNTKGSQFVWIPIGNVYYDSCEHFETITLGRYNVVNFDGSLECVQSAENWEDTSDTIAIDRFKELATNSGPSETAKNLGDFIEKTTTSGGYYIGRYEAGDATATSLERTDSSSDSNPIVCKAGVYPYTYINQPDASKLCREMYSSSNFESDLINSYVWGTTGLFIQTFSGDENYSMQVGQNTKNALQKCGESILANIESGDEARDVRCNIYDMAGNTHEWTTETEIDSLAGGVLRGGVFDDDSLATFSYGTGRATNDYGELASFRPILYL